MEAAWLRMKIPGGLWFGAGDRQVLVWDGWSMNGTPDATGLSLIAVVWPVYVRFQPVSP